MDDLTDEEFILINFYIQSYLILSKKQKQLIFSGPQMWGFASFLFFIIVKLNLFGIYTICDTK